MDTVQSLAPLVEPSLYEQLAPWVITLVFIALKNVLGWKMVPEKRWRRGIYQ